MPEIEADRAVLITESYMQSEGKPIITRRAEAFEHAFIQFGVIIQRNNQLMQPKHILHNLLLGDGFMVTHAARGCKLAAQRMQKQKKTRP